MIPRVGLVYHRTALPWIFAAARRVGCELVLLARPDERSNEVDRPDPVVGVLHCDVLNDQEGSIERLARYQRAHRLDGLLTMYDPAVPFTAAAAARLGLPGLGQDIGWSSVDKCAVRAALVGIGANTPAFLAVPDSTYPPRPDGLQFPVVVKPAAGYSSVGVARVDHPGRLPGELRRIADVVRDQLPPDAAARGLLVEEYVDGPEYAVESFVHDARTHVLSIGYKGEPTGPYFEESIYRAPARLTRAEHAAIAHQARLANEALGITTGPVHTELRLHADGRPFVVDVGARVGGSGVSDFIVRHSTGVDLAGNALRAALGWPPVGLPDGDDASDMARPLAHVGNYIVQCGGSGIIAEVTGLAGLGADTGMRHVLRFMFPGDEVRPYPEFSGYPAFVLSVHRSSAELTAFHRHLDRTVTVRYRNRLAQDSEV